MVCRRKLAPGAAYLLGLAWIALVVRPLAAGDPDVYTPEERAHWSLRPRSASVPPPAASGEAAAWLANPIDAFISARLQRAGLAPSAEADRPALVRRLHFNLLGLPPAPELIEGFLRDVSPDAYERLVDRLLANPHYGEAWTQHWLDVVRYAESEGFEYDRHRPGAWRFRDYVIRSFNADKPFDRFILEQVAGDEVAKAESGEPKAEGPLSTFGVRLLEPLIAAGFHRLGPVRRNAGNTDVAFSRNEVLTELTDAIGASFLGLTVGCARCHDHMFDPIRQRDYYRLQAFFAATLEHDIQLGDPVAIGRWKTENDAIQAEIKRLRDAIEEAPTEEERDKLAYELKKAQKRQPTPLPTISSVANDAAKRSEIHVLELGQTDKPKEVVGPRVLGVLLGSSDAEYPADIASPKSALAQWLIAPENPLIARVYVNRLWHYQFGTGLVSTPNDFGVNGSQPSHPELLDYLANELVRGEWSTKRLQRLIVTSSTYRQSSEPRTLNPEPSLTDPDNRLLWHFPRRRLTAEEVRDGMLAASGRLNTAFGGDSVMPPVKKELVDLLYDPAQWQVTPDKRQYDRRSVYLVAKRNLRLPFLEVFDQPDLQTSCARRQSSTHAPQALELLNGEAASDLAVAFAERLKAEAGAEPSAVIEGAFLLAAGRQPTPAEQKLALTFLKNQPLDEFALAIFNLNAFLYVD
jgi:hypothetical protein